LAVGLAVVLRIAVFMVVNKRSGWILKKYSGDI